jgi:hypothetical protein
VRGFRYHRASGVLLRRGHLRASELRQPVSERRATVQRCWCPRPCARQRGRPGSAASGLLAACHRYRRFPAHWCTVGWRRGPDQRFRSAMRKERSKRRSPRRCPKVQRLPSRPKHCGFCASPPSRQHMLRSQMASKRLGCRIAGFYAGSVGGVTHTFSNRGLRAVRVAVGLTRCPHLAHYRR